MDLTLLDLLDPQELRLFSGGKTFERGSQYHRLGRVKLESVDLYEARCTVWGTQVYHVGLFVSHDDLGAMCTCPHADSGWFCKHMVAASLAVFAHLKANGPDAWRQQITRLLEGTQGKKPQANLPKPYWLFFSLQPDTQNWSLKPFCLYLDPVITHLLEQEPQQTLQSLPELVIKNPWLLKNIKPARSDLSYPGCINAGQEVIAFARILLRTERQFTSSYYYNFTPQTQPLAEYLSFLSQLDLPLFMGDPKNPLGKRLRLVPEPCEVTLDLARGEDGLRLHAQLAIGAERIALQREVVDPLTSSHPYWFLLGETVVEIRPPGSIAGLFQILRAPHLQIPPREEPEFLEHYLPSLLEQFALEGDQINWQEVAVAPVKRLYLSDEGGELLATLRFGYGDSEVVYDPDLPEHSVQRLPGDAWTLLRLRRQPLVEQEAYDLVSSPSHGLKRGGKDYPPQVFLLRARIDPVDFLLHYVSRLTESGFEIYGEEKLKSTRVNRSRPSLSLNVNSGIDWFDLQAVVTFGDTDASLKEIRQALKKKKRYVKLADGTIGEIPEEWIERYKHLFNLGEQQDDGVRLSNHHLTLIDQLLAQADRVQADDVYQQRRNRLLGFEGIQPQPLPQGFRGELRPYQKAGFDWLHFLHEYEFGGCLADDMGLGKTIEALAFLLSLKESEHATAASLLVLPRSLLINWQREAARFAPELRLLEYFGQDRQGALLDFKDYDLVLTTYGVMLRDVERLRQYKFHYVVLDESQAIKNPLAKTSKAARLLRCDHRLVLTGTPVENSTFELWSQFAFLNPGLLGNLEYFRTEFGNPIEKQANENASEFLRKMVYPFILRRTKSQVAPELPPRTERVIYADMEPAQRKFYHKTRDYYRAMLLGVIEQQGMQNARMQVLEGLLRLRQICNHPRLVDAGFRGESAKFELLIDTLETLQAEGHKALVFSQFVQMLTIVRAALEARKIPYVYLDGSTRDRQAPVDTFQQDQSIPFFLISLKAGGVGLNLTAADYVIHIDPWWNPAVELQATDRTHRIGQDKPVFVYKLIVRDSVEEKILQLQDKKKALVEQLISTESSFFKNLTVDDVKVLFS